MRSGVKFSEVYTDPDSDIGKVDVASGWKPRRNASDPEHMFDVILRLSQEREHGGRFEYRSIETDVMAFCMERVTGKRLAELVGTELWSKLGAEEDANFTVDPAGYAQADGGFNATLRDYARFGQLHLDGGMADGVEVVPADWVEACGQGDPVGVRRALHGCAARRRLRPTVLGGGRRHPAPIWPAACSDSSSISIRTIRWSRSSCRPGPISRMWPSPSIRFGRSMRSAAKSLRGLEGNHHERP